MGKRPHVYIYIRGDGKYEWNLRAANGRHVCGSQPQGFNSVRDAARAALRARELLDAAVFAQEAD